MMRWKARLWREGIAATRKRAATHARCPSVWPLALAAAMAGACFGFGGAERPFLMGAEAVERELPYETDADVPVSLLLSKSVYPAEDRHLDAIVWLRGEGGELRFELRGEDGLLRRERLAPVPGGTVFASAAFPGALAGRGGELRVQWLRGGRTMGEARAGFEVAPASPTAQSGRIRLAVPNASGAVLRGVPMTVGVPFPRGALADARGVRLVDEAGAEVPLQTKVTSRWSRFGYVRWLLCDFSVDVDGTARELFLEFGPQAERAEPETAWAAPAEGEGFPAVLAGPLRLDGTGVHFDADGTGEFVRVLDAEALRGAFVEHEGGKTYAVPADARYRIEESGPVKTVVLREGWYAHPETGEEFCKYATRFVVHRGSPLLRIFHTWIFTGDAWEDRIANMGWRFPTAAPYEPAGFLSSYGDGGEWLTGDCLLQHDYDKFRVHADGEPVAEGGRAPGVFAATVGGVRLTVGNRHFWQNFPHELEFAPGALAYHMWPKHAGPAEREVTPENAMRLWFAHEGDKLDFAVPRAYTEDPRLVERLRPGYTLADGKYRYTINAQGTAKTAELWLLFQPEAEEADAASARVMAGLEQDTLRAIADPAWQAASGAFYEMHPEDREQFPEAEAAYEKHALAPYHWAERVQIYGKWIWGDMVWAPDLHNRTTRGIYRGFRKAHQGWPYPWIPFARSGDPRYFALADAATRYMADVPYVHYADERAVISVHVGGGERRDVPRPRGRWERYHIPWGHHQYWRGPEVRGYADKCNYLWHSYYMTGYHRARDVALDWGELTKTRGGGRESVSPVFDYPRIFEFSRSNRITVSLLQSYVEMYEATYDPWFLAAAHQIAENAHLKAYNDDIDAYEGEVHGEMFAGQERTFDVDEGAYDPRVFAGHAFHSGSREFLRFTGCPRYREFYLHYARIWDGQGRGRGLEPVSYAYLLTGDEFFLRRAKHGVNWTVAETYSGEPDYMAGMQTRGARTADVGLIFTPYCLKLLPNALYALDRADGQVRPEPRAFFQAPYDPVPRGEDGLFEWTMPAVAVRKEAGEALPLLLRVNQERRPDEGKAFSYRIEDGEGAEVRSGEWENVHDTLRVRIPADAPAGTYWVRVVGKSNFSNVRGGWGWGNRRMPALRMPLSPPGTPEVMVLSPGEGIGKGHYEAQHWFRVPEDAEELAVAIGLERYRPPFNTLARAAVWDESLGLVWKGELDQAYDQDRRSIEANIPVPADQRGRLWRITAPFFHMGIMLDERVPRIFAASPERWFEP